jgi:MoaA/NifB/PqqE/SkfB family radical SAM enzyme
MLLNEENIINLCSRNVPSVTVSLDGCKKKTVELFKTGLDFDRVVSNVKLLRKIARKNIGINTVFVATSANIGELIEYVDFCSDLGVDRIFVNGFLSYFPETSSLCLYSKTGNTKTYELFIKAYERAKEKGIFIQFPSLTAKPMGCGLTSYMCIDESGNVSPCIHLARKTPFALFSNTKVASPVIYGNVLDDEPVYIWNKKEYAEFRRKLKHQEIPGECALCADAYGVICSNRKLVP